MKKTLTILSVALVAFMLSSCVEKSKKYQQLMAEKEAVVLENQNIEREYNAALGIISDVENNLQALRDAEGMMLIKNESNSQRDQLNSELIQIKETMAMNRAKLDSLSTVLDKSNKDRAYLRNTIKKLQAQLAEKEATIAQMQEQLAQKDQEIEGLNTKVNNLNENLNVANAKNEEQSRLIADQVLEMNKVYYVGASKRTLKEKGILERGFLSTSIMKQEIPADTFTEADKRELKSIVFEGRKVNVLSAHPLESYTIVRNENQVVVEISNPELFWSVTKYFVATVK
jgi:DNA repair exonuclease SbcCD ATPase subunit